MPLWVNVGSGWCCTGHWVPHQVHQPNGTCREAAGVVQQQGHLPPTSKHALHPVQLLKQSRFTAVRGRGGRERLQAGIT
jgi:hypothetical protein